MTKCPNISSRADHRKKKRGFTLTEIAIVLGIIGLILGAIWAAASSVYANLKANQAQQGILSAAQAVRSIFATSANTGAAGGSITTPGMFPVSWQSAQANGIVGNPWHVNPVAGKNYSYVLGNGQLFAIQLDGISDTGCAQLAGFYNFASSGANGGQVPGLVATFVSAAADAGGTAVPVSLVGAWPVAGAAPVVGNFSAPTNCNQGGLLDGVAVVFDMSIM